MFYSLKDEHFLISVATIVVIGIAALPEVIGVMIFYKIGVFFEQLSVKKSRNSIQSLLTLKPTYANLEINGMHVASGSLRMEVSRAYQDSSIQRIMYMVEHAADNKTKTEKFITTWIF